MKRSPKDAEAYLAEIYATRIRDRKKYRNPRVWRQETIPKTVGRGAFKIL